MGTHPNVPSYDANTGATLKDRLESNAQLLSPDVAKVYENDLPFLFKILSIQKALSIQAHPDKELAKKLHKENPKFYKDPNHKPEMALALTPFEGFCGFRPLKQIVGHLEEVSELRDLVGQDKAKAFIETVKGKEESKDEAVVKKNKAALKDLFEALVTKKEDVFKPKVQELVSRLKQSGSDDELDKLIVRLDGQFPGDIGIFCGYFLNYVKLQPGQACFLRANDPHGYISGDIVECMAASDNVVRAGLTPKPRDVPVLVSMLTYNYAPPEEQSMKPEAYKNTKHTKLYDPPIDEFSVLMTTLSKGDSESIDGIAGPSVVICTNGKGSIKGAGVDATMTAGNVYFIGAGAEVEHTNADEEDFVLYRAYCEVKK